MIEPRRGEAGTGGENEVSDSRPLPLQVQGVGQRRQHGRDRRPLHRLDIGLRAGASWADMKLAGVGDELAAQTVGVVGAGQIGKRVIRMLRAWDVTVRVYDPFMTPVVAAAMEVTATLVSTACKQAR